MVELVLMAGQYVAGMYLNLFATIPPMFGGGMMGGGMMAFMSSPSMPVLMFHMMNALLLLVLALLVMAGAWLAREPALALAASLALMGVVLALVAGLAYLIFGSDTDSLVMALGFLLAFTMTVWGLALAWRWGPRAAGPPPVPRTV